MNHFIWKLIHDASFVLKTLPFHLFTLLIIIPFITTPRIALQNSLYFYLTFQKAINLFNMITPLHWTQAERNQN